MCMRPALAVLACVALAVCPSCSGSSGGSAQGTIVGRMVAIGGPVGASARPLSGKVTATGSETRTVDVPSDGRFILRVSPGIYGLTGRSPQYRVDGKSAMCGSLGLVHVEEHQTASADVVCAEK